jgi:hypothetical protein
MTSDNRDTNQNGTNKGLNILFFSGIGLVLILGMLGTILWIQIVQTGGFNFHSGRRVRLPTVSSSTTPVKLDEVVAAINKGGCIACHTIPNIPGAIGQIGPDLSKIGIEAASRREGYTAEEYIRESLNEPSAFTAPECPTGPCPSGIMPQLPLDEAEVETIVYYLSTLGVSQVSLVNP